MKVKNPSMALFSTTTIKPTQTPTPKVCPLFARHAPNVFFFFFFISSVVICQQPANPRNNRKKNPFFIWHLTFPQPLQKTFVKPTKEKGKKKKKPFYSLFCFFFFSPLCLFSLFYPLSGVIIKLLVPAREL